MEPVRTKREQRRTARRLRKQRKYQSAYRERQKEAQGTMETETEMRMRLETQAHEAQRKTKAANLSVQDWLPGLSDEEWDALAGCHEGCRDGCRESVLQMLAVWEMVDRETREKWCWLRRLYFCKNDKASKDAIFTDQWLDDAEKRMKELGVTLDELRAADYIFDRAVAAKSNSKPAIEADLQCSP